MKAADIFEQTTATIIEAIEAGAAEWRMPWTRITAMPRNAKTDTPYGGGNALVLMVLGLDRGYDAPQWATFKQWQELGGQVRKGERAVHLVRWVEPKAEKVRVEEEGGRARVVPVGFAVFNAAQVDGWDAPAPAAGLDEAERIAAAEAFFAAVGAEVVVSPAGMAAYSPVADRIELPAFGSFRSGLDYYSTSAHEHAHWTGHASRLNRDLSGRFGDDAYAMEELVAELSAAFTCATLGLAPAPRPDHAAYLAHWLKVLRSDPKALYASASLAQAATNHLAGLAARVEEAVAA